MEFVNTLYKLAEKDDFRSLAWQFCLKTLAMLLAPFAPHFTSELWQQLGRLDSVHCDHWPRLDEKYLIGETIIIPIQVNGKLRGRLEIAPDISKEEILRLAKEQESVACFAQNDGGLFYLSWAAIFSSFMVSESTDYNCSLLYSNDSKRSVQ